MTARNDGPTALPARRGAARAGCILVVLAVAFSAGCAPFRHRIKGEEAGAASALFASSARLSFPVRASFSGVAEVSGRTIPFVAGLFARSASDETLGVYDPMGNAVLFLDNAGGRLSVVRGPAAAQFPPPDLRPVDAGPLSLGRILSGAPGYPVSGGRLGRDADGAWVLAADDQTLFSDPSRRLLSRAEYDIAGRRVTVTYPDRESPGPPRTVEVEVMGNTIVLRRDAE